MIKELEKKDYLNMETIFNIDSIENQLQFNPYKKIYIYEEKDEILGYIEFSIIFDKYELDNIEVLKSKRKKGIGQKLLQLLIDIAENDNAINITLEVNVDNDTAINLYKKNKFEKVAIRKRYYRDKDGYLMERKMIR